MVNIFDKNERLESFYITLQFNKYLSIIFYKNFDKILGICSLKAKKPLLEN